MALLSTVETCSVSNLSWCCLTVLLVCWGRKTRCLVVLLLILITSLLAVLTILLLLLRVLSLKLLLMRTLILILISLWVTRSALLR